jgi:hypothetical protein
MDRALAEGQESDDDEENEQHWVIDKEILFKAWA